ncbi:uncharacterized protein LOC133198135 [Saccostrea echinata]|uniref:uncharacterized protein LOC133198135 n=1 Tax=Saccostrea echinata TaxID=191078 RepID=UPI002A841BBA|nr:uncharacterized protein LOC133198135 [Saccostrea echinata]
MTSTLVKGLVLYVLVTNYVIVTTAILTINRPLLGLLIAGSVLVPYAYGNMVLTPELLALLTTGLLLVTIPTSQTATLGNPTCTATGYEYNPLTGCFRVFKGLVTNTEAQQQCNGDGGRLLLVNSEAEADVLITEMEAIRLSEALVQGSRSNASDPWKDDSGNPLPYTGNTIRRNDRDSNTIIGMRTDKDFQALNPSTKVEGFICETSVTYV